MIDATTTAIFNNTGLTASAIQSFLLNIFSQGYSFLVYTFTTLWPFWLVLGFIGIVIGIGFAMMHLRH